MFCLDGIRIPDLKGNGAWVFIWLGRGVGAGSRPFCEFFLFCFGLLLGVAS